MAEYLQAIVACMGVKGLEHYKNFKFSNLDDWAYQLEHPTHFYN